MQLPDIQPPEQVRYVLERLRSAGHEAYVVGGCVRDALMGKEPHDWDVATSAEPYLVKDLFFGTVQVDDGLKHGTVMLILGGSPVEVTTFRIDGNYTDGRRPDNVAFTSDITEDLARRDFTINACAWGDGVLIDPFGGRTDIEKHVIRCVGEPEKRFSEDALRILRGIRFSSVLGFSVEEKTKDAMFACSHLLKNVSQERISAEFIKTLTGANVYDTLSIFREILVLIVPEVKPMIGFDQHNPHHVYDVFEHTLRAVQAIDSDPILRAAALFHDIAKPACFTRDQKGIGHFYGHTEQSAVMTESILRRMRFSTDYTESVSELVRYHDDELGHTVPAIKKWLHRLGEASMRRLLLLKRADASAQNPAYTASSLQCIDAAESLLDQIIAQNACVSLRDLAVNGKDLIGTGIPEGIQLGKTLEHLLALVLEDKSENTKEALLREAYLFYRKTQ